MPALDEALTRLEAIDAEQARMEQPQVGFVLPQEGSTIWLDSLAMPRGARHPRAAHEFMNYVLRPPVAAGVSTATGYGTPNREALGLIEHPVRYPSGEELAQEALEEMRSLIIRLRPPQGQAAARPTS